jgi:autoinducer 2-degrading protein
MITRIVKMKFKSEKIESFLKIFNESQPLIKACEGCNDVKLFQDKMDHSTLFTISYWADQESLEKYRASDLFKTTWARTKVLFDAKPEAWSMEEVKSEK